MSNHNPNQHIPSGSDSHTTTDSTQTTADQQAAAVVVETRTKKIYARVDGRSNGLRAAIAPKGDARTAAVEPARISLVTLRRLTDLPGAREDTIPVEVAPAALTSHDDHDSADADCDDTEQTPLTDGGRAVPESEHEHDPESEGDDPAPTVTVAADAVPERCTVDDCRATPEWGAALSADYDRVRRVGQWGPSIDGLPDGTVAPAVCEGHRRRSRLAIGPDEWVRLRIVRADGGQATTPDAAGVGPTGPVIFGHETARTELLSEGVVYSFRAGERTEGRTRWRTERTGASRGVVLVEELARISPVCPATLRPYADRSGFDSADHWFGAILGFHDHLPLWGTVYQVRSVPGHCLQCGRERARLHETTGADHGGFCPDCYREWKRDAEGSDP